MSKKRMSDELYNADHTARQIAIKIIENVIEPLHYPKRGVNGEKYYELEDKITRIVAGV
jgi:hypothetical protein